MTIRVIVSGQSIEFSDACSASDITSHLEELYHTSTFVVKNTNKPLDIISRVLSLVAVYPLKGGKGGFGANLRSKKTKNPKNDSRNYYRDLKTGARIRDLERLKLASEILLKQSTKKQEEKQEVDRKKEKLRKTIEYYERILEGKSTDQTKFEDTEFLDATDKLMEDLRETMDLALQSLEEESDSDSEDEEVPEEPKAKEKPKFAKFFDDSDND